MPNQNYPLEISITNTINDIPEKDWENLFDRDIIEGWGYHKTLEESGLSNFSFQYLVAKRNENLVAIVPFFFTDFSLTTIIQGPLQKLILNLQKIFKRFLTMKTLFVGFPTAEELYLGISKEENLKEILGLVLKKLYIFAKNKKINTILFYNLKEKHNLLAEYLSKNGFAKMENFPNTVLTIDSRSQEEYLKTLSRNTRKDLKRRLKKSAVLVNLRTDLAENIDQIKDQVYKLYLSNLYESDIQFEVLTPEFFQNISRNLNGNAKFFITKVEDKIVAFNLCLVKNQTCIDKFVGFDPQVSHQYNLYYVTFWNNLAWCMQNGIRFYQMGITDYYPKLRLGAKLIPLFVYIKSFNPLINLPIKLLVRIFAPKNFDPTLKNSLNTRSGLETHCK